FKGAYLSVVSSLCKLVATGAKFEDVYLTFQEYFERLGKDEKKWGKPLSALLGALEAQLDYSVAAIGGKDSMSGTFENISVPPTLVSFAVTTGKVSDAVSPEFKTAGDDVYLLSPALKENGLPDPQSQIALFDRITDLCARAKS
ncbi:MAG: phosphoribosylformylglycinamidine synthase, partial [Christensenellales bacterium]